MSNQTGYQRYAHRAGDARDNYGNGSQVAEKQVSLLTQTLFFLVS